MSSLLICLPRRDNFPSDLKMCKEVQDLHTLVFAVFHVNTPAGLYNLCLEVGVKIDSQHAVEKILDRA